MVVRNRTSEREREETRERDEPRARFSGKGSKFVYQKREAKDVDERINASGAMFDSYIASAFTRFKPAAGDHNIRILPPGWDKARQWGYAIWLHNNVGADNSAYLCPAKMNGEECPICEAYSQMMQDGDEEDAKKIRAGQRFLCWLIDRKNENAGPLLYAMPQGLENDIQRLSKDRRTGQVVFIDDPEEGYDIWFSRTGSGLGTKYGGVELDRERSPLSAENATAQKWLEFISDNALPQILKFYPAEYLDKVVNGRAPSRRSEADDERPSREPERESRESGRRRLSLDEEEGEDKEEERPTATARHADSNSRSNGDARNVERGQTRSARSDEDDQPPFDTDKEDADPEPERTRKSVQSQGKAGLSKLRQKARE